MEQRLFNVVEFMMHDKDKSGSIDMDECMEILFRRFGKEQLEARVSEFMSNDEDAERDFLHRVPAWTRGSIAGTSKRAGFRQARACCDEAGE